MSASTYRSRRRHVAFAATLTLTFMLTLTTVAPAFASGEALTRISSDPYTNPTSQHKTQVEPDTFAFGTTVVAVVQSGRFFDGGASNIGFATSTNAGETWTHGFLPGTTVYATPAGPYGRVSDPSIAYDVRHNVWIVSYLGIVNPSTGPVDVLVSRSTDGGLTWGAPVAVNTSGNFNDKNWSVCDDGATSPFYGNCYTEFDDASNNNLVQMSTSTDGGLTWGPALTTPDHTCVIGGQPVVQPNGTVIVPIDDCFESTVLAFRSTDGGKSWTRPVLVAQLVNAFNPGNIRSPFLPTAEIDRTGRVYVVFQDCRFEPGCSTNDLDLTTSDDGVHWSLQKRIPIDAIGSGVDHLIPGLAVDRSTAGDSAHLGLAYYYFPNANCGTSSTPACQLDVGFVSSVNGGKSWSTAEQLAGPMMLSWLANTNQGRMVGDYISTSIVPGDDDATPVFTVAFAPTGGSTCGATGVVCHQATYTTPEDLATIAGGTLTSSGDKVLSTKPASRLAAPATAF